MICPETVNFAKTLNFSGVPCKTHKKFASSGRTIILATHDFQFYSFSWRFVLNLRQNDPRMGDIDGWFFFKAGRKRSKLKVKTTSQFSTKTTVLLKHSMCWLIFNEQRWVKIRPSISIRLTHDSDGYSAGISHSILCKVDQKSFLRPSFFFFLFQLLRNWKISRKTASHLPSCRVIQITRRPCACAAISRSQDLLWEEPRRSTTPELSMELLPAFDKSLFQ